MEAREKDAPEAGLPSWFVWIFPISLGVFATGHPWVAASICVGAALLLPWQTRKRPADEGALKESVEDDETWHSFVPPNHQDSLEQLQVGTLLCVISVVVTIFAYYMTIKTASFGPSGIWLLVGLAGTMVFRKGIDVRFTAQIALSRLSAYRIKHFPTRRGDLPLVRQSPLHAFRITKLGLWGIITCSVGSLAFSSAMLGLGSLITRNDNPSWGPFAVVVLVIQGIFLTVLGNATIRRGVQQFADVIRSPDELSPRTYALYLRPFKNDRRLSRPHRIPLIGAWLVSALSFGRSEEERISAALAWAGPLVAVGAPGERVPYAGAKRMYLPSTNWKGSVRRLMRNARLVVIMIGIEPGTLWEIGEAIRIVPPERLVFLVPMTRRGFENFREIATDSLQRQRQLKSETKADEVPLPRFPDYSSSPVISSWVRGVIYFDSQWNSKFVPLQKPSRLEDQLMGGIDRSMWPVAVQLTAYEKNAGGSKR